MVKLIRRTKYLVLILILSLVVVLLVGCNPFNSNGNNNNDEGVVWETHETDYYAFQYPPEWDIYYEDQADYFVEIVPDLENDEDSFVFSVELLKGETMEELKEDLEDLLEEMEANEDETIINGENTDPEDYQTIINNYPAYIIEYKVGDLESNLRKSWIFIHDSENDLTADVLYSGEEDDYDNNSEIAGKMVESFKFLK
ncbi:hypothetical protein [Fuchsiella alkaliacetigena]|uniref:hypothetical protein n=1 Tax=Fuchsiella alkaliacetigena TaxID=957042 RepID=UPI00200AEFC8|nr:hypothetical protein [Fuchsiella alkaliacetigena]MCK8824966.1 hypothetical protein [Fuchsiella alkaliacetigena]